MNMNLDTNSFDEIQKSRQLLLYVLKVKSNHLGHHL